MHFINTRDAIRYCHGLQCTARLKCSITNTRDAITYSHGLQCTAISKCVMRNSRHATTYSHGLQCIAISKCITANTRDVITYSHGLQCTAISKCFRGDCPIDQSRPIIGYSHMSIAIWSNSTYGHTFTKRLLHISSKIKIFTPMMPQSRRKASIDSYFFFSKLFYDRRHTILALKCIYNTYYYT